MFLLPRRCQQTFFFDCLKILRKKPIQSIRSFVVSVALSIDNDFFLPNAKWPKDAINVYNDLNKLTEDGKWVKFASPIPPKDAEARAFVRACDSNMYTGAMFLNLKDMVSRGVITFQGWTEGGTGHVHGGAVATIFDTSMGVLTSQIYGFTVTANLSINYKNRLPLFTTVLIDSKVDGVDNRKVFLSSLMKSVDSKIEYASSTSLFILLPSKS